MERKNYGDIITLYEKGKIRKETPKEVVDKLLETSDTWQKKCPFIGYHRFNVGDSFMRPWTNNNSILTLVGIDYQAREYICNSSLFRDELTSPTIRVSFADDYRLQPVCGCSCCQCCNRMAFCDFYNRPIFGVGDMIKWSYDKDSAVLVVDDIDLCGKRYRVHNGNYCFTISFENNDLLTLVSSACPVSCCKVKFNVGDIIQFGCGHDKYPYLKIIEVDYRNEKYLVEDLQVPSCHFYIPFDEKLTLACSAHSGAPYCKNCCK